MPRHLREIRRPIDRPVSDKSLVGNLRSPPRPDHDPEAGIELALTAAVILAFAVAAHSFFLS